MSKMRERHEQLEKEIGEMYGQEISEVINELERATKNFPSMVSAHEGYAILKEEVDELWDEVKEQHGVRDQARMRDEAKQIAAMAIRFMRDLT